MNDICYEKVIGVAGKHHVLIFEKRMGPVSRESLELVKNDK